MQRSVVVVGAGVGGLSAAIHARLAGHDVLVLEQHATPGGKAAGISIKGYELDPGPSIIILPRVYEAVFHAAGHKMSDYLVFDRLDTITRVFYGSEGPVDLPADEAACLDVVRQIDKSDAESLARLLDRIEGVAPLLERTVFAKPYLAVSDLASLDLMRFGLALNPFRGFKAQVDSMFRSHLARAFFYGFPSYGGQSYRANAPGGFLIPFFMLRDGVFFPRGGVRAIPQALHRLAEELGVSFRFEAEVTGFETSDTRITAVQLRDGERVAADAVISNVDRYHVSSWLGRQETRAPSYSYFTVHRGVHQELPLLKHHTLFVPESFEDAFADLYNHGRFPREPIVYVNATKALDPKAAPDGSENVFCVVTSPACVPGVDWSRESAAYVARIDRVLSQFGVTWEPHQVDFVRIQNPPYFEKTHGSYGGSLYGLDEKFRQWGMFPAGNRDATVTNLFYCGGSVQPGAGLPMVTLSGKFAADMIGR